MKDVLSPQNLPQGILNYPEMRCEIGRVCWIYWRWGLKYNCCQSSTRAPLSKKTEKLLLLTQQCLSCEESMSCEFMCCVRFKPNDQPGATIAVFLVYECGWHPQYFDHLCGQNKVKIPEILSQYYAKLHVTDFRKKYLGLEALTAGKHFSQNNS